MIKKYAGKYKRIKLKDVFIRGYKSIDYSKGVNISLGKINILLGANGAGKSNIVSFFRMLSYMMSKSFARYVEMAGTSNSLLYYGSKQTPCIEGVLTFTDDKSEDIYRFKLASAAPDRLIVTEESIQWHRKGEAEPYEVLLEPNFKESSLADSQDAVAKSIYWMLSNCKVYQFHDSSAEGPLRQACPVETADYLQSRGNNLPSFLYFLRENYIDSYNRIVSYVRDAVPQFQDFYLEPVGKYISLRWVDTSANDYVFNAHQFSDGSIRFIALATLLLQPQKTMPSVIILDEPELGLHPFAITQLAQMIRDASNHSQVIIASQSKDLVDHFELGDVSVVEMDDERLYTTVRKLNEDDYRLWLENYTVSELWDKNIIGGRPV
ncbi:AAA family ATPase [Parabacteroides distasonis]|nr:AAA family ATPase [Parabacteroides distasonis]